MGILDQATKKSGGNFARTFVIKVTGYEGLNDPDPSKAVVKGVSLDTGAEIKVRLAESTTQDDRRQTVVALSRPGVKGAAVGALLRCDRAVETAPGEYKAAFFQAITSGPNDQRGRHYLRGMACVYPTYTNQARDGTGTVMSARVGLIDNDHAINVSNRAEFDRAVMKCCFRGGGTPFDQFSVTNVAFVREPGSDKLWRIPVGRIRNDEGNYRPATLDEMKASLLENKTFMQLRSVIEQAGECDVQVVPGSMIRVGYDTMMSKAFEFMQARYDANFYIKKEDRKPDAHPSPGFMDTHLTLLKRHTGDFIVISAAPSEADRLSPTGVPMPWDNDQSPGANSKASTDIPLDIPLGETARAATSAPASPPAQPAAVAQQEPVAPQAEMAATPPVREAAPAPATVATSAAPQEPAIQAPTPESVSSPAAGAAHTQRAVTDYTAARDGDLDLDTPPQEPAPSKEQVPVAAATADTARPAPEQQPPMTTEPPVSFDDLDSYFEMSSVGADESAVDDMLNFDEMIEEASRKLGQGYSGPSL